MRSAGWAAWASILAAIGAVGCVPPRPETISLRMQGNVPTASVTIDDQYLGALSYVARHGVAMPVGVHRVTVEKAGYFPWDKLVEAKAGSAPVMLKVEMVRVPD